MHPIVRASFADLTTPHEGDIPHMYRDSLGLVTVAIGQLIDFSGKLDTRALAWPWTLGNGRLATDAQVRAEFARIKAGPLYNRGAASVEKIATMHLPRPDRVAILDATLLGMARTLVQQLPDWGTWPADAQLAMLSSVWNLGASLSGWPTLWQRLRARDWLYASDSYKPGDATAAKAARWAETRLLWTYAALVDSDLGGAALIPRDQLQRPHIRLAELRRVIPRASGWLVQRQLKVTGHYTLKLDGQFGPKSQAALQAFTKGAKLTSAPASRATLTTLGKAARLTIPVED